MALPSKDRIPAAEGPSSSRMTTHSIACRGHKLPNRIICIRYSRAVIPTQPLRFVMEELDHANVRSNASAGMLPKHGGANYATNAYTDQCISIRPHHALISQGRSWVSSADPGNRRI